MRAFLALIGITAVLASLTGCATDLLTSGRVVIGDENTSVAISFSNRDRELIHDYYARSYKKKKSKRTPPGLAKRGRHLPSGLAKRDTLPPGLQGRSLPADLESSLSPISKGYVRVIVGSDVVIMNRNTRVVIDIYRDAVAE
jgi:hypothetical protein